MSRVLFSIPVHERPDIVRDQIENIQHFCPNATVCIHVSAAAAAQMRVFERYCDLPNVLVNPNSFETGLGTGILHTHVSNFEYSILQGVDFDKVVLLSSNEMLVKDGVGDFVSGYSHGAQTEVCDKSVDWHLFHSPVRDDVRVKGFLKKLGLPLFFGGQAEGQFFSKKDFSHIHRLYTEFFPMGPCGFVVEELVPPTFGAYLCMTGKNAAQPITVCDYCTNLPITEDVITQVRSGIGSLFAMKIPRTLRSPHHGVSSLASIFSVKRVPREDCDLRRVIRGLWDVQPNDGQTAAGE